MTIPSDNEIEQLIAQGQLTHAQARIAYRQMRALETIAEQLVKLMSPPMVLMDLDRDPGALRPGNLTFVPNGAPEGAGEK